MREEASSFMGLAEPVFERIVRARKRGGRREGERKGERGREKEREREREREKETVCSHALKILLYPEINSSQLLNNVYNKILL